MPVLPDGTIVNDKGVPTGQTVNLATNQVSGAITPSMLSPTPSANFQTPSAPAPFNVQSLIPAPLEPTKPEQDAGDIITSLKGLYSQNIGQSSYQGEQDAKYGIPELVKTQNDLTAQLQALSNESLSLQNAYNYTIPNVMQENATGRGITQAGLAPITASELRKNQIQQGAIATRALTVKSTLEAVQGNLSTAKYYADQAVAQRFNPIKERIAAATANLDLILKSPAYSLADKNRAEAQKSTQEAKARDVARQEENFKTVQALAVSAIKNYAGNQGAQMVAQQALALDPSDPSYLVNAINLLGKYQNDPQQLLKDADAHLKAQQDILKSQVDVANAPLERQKLQAEIANLEETRKKIIAETVATGQSGIYVPGTDPTVDNWARLIISGQATITQVPNPKGSTLRSQVVDAITNSGQILLSDKDREKLSTLDTAFNTANTIKSLSEGINQSNAFGRVAGAPGKYLGGLTQSDTDISLYNSVREGFVSNVARTLGEKGALAEGDVKRAIANLPTIYDTKDVAEAKIKTLFSILEGAKTSIVQKSTEPIAGMTSGTTGGLAGQVAAKGYDYQKMKADGLSDEEIKKAVGL